MRKTIRMVTIVVPVLITSCQVSEKWKIGPSMAQITMTNPAPANAHLDPNHPDAEAANCPNQSFEVRVCISRGDLFIPNLHILKPRHYCSNSGEQPTRSLTQRTREADGYSPDKFSWIVAATASTEVGRPNSLISSSFEMLSRPRCSAIC